jgi:hypothetical protein
MKKVSHPFMLLFAVILSIKCYAQNPKMNRISLESGSVIGGVVGISYERRIIKKLAAFGGVSVLNNSNDEPFGFGLGIRLIPEDDIAGFILSLSYGTGALSISSFGTEGNDYIKGVILLGGYRFNIKQVIDIELGAGIQILAESKNAPTPGSFITVTGAEGVTFALNLGIGYHF